MNKDEFSKLTFNQKDQEITKQLSLINEIQTLTKENEELKNKIFLLSQELGKSHKENNELKNNIENLKFDKVNVFTQGMFYEHNTKFEEEKNI
jgi:uncharacterized protein YlxW (UPF0749 family)